MTEITREHVDHWLEHGWVVVPGFLGPAEVAAVEVDIDALLAQPIGERNVGTDDEFRFPYAGSAMNALVAHPRLLAFIEQALGTRELMLTESLFWPKHAGAANYQQGLHLDYSDVTLTFPRDEGDFRQMMMAIYLSDVTEDLGPLHLVSQRHTGHLTPYRQLKRGEHPELAEHELAIVGPAGTLVVWGMRTWHRGSAFRAETGHRYAQFFTYHAARHRWMGSRFPYWASEPMRRFLIEASPRARELVGFPGVGHEYWTEETIVGVASRYPELDMEPYRAALAG
jgi:hypothetical protein